MNVVKMTEEYACFISSWKYDGIYSFYDHNENGIADFMDGTHFACLDENDKLIGYFCFGADARIPTVENYIYTEDFLDIGLGLKPDLCGKGLGLAFINKGLDFAQKHFNITKFRLSVAVFNERAINVYLKAGFSIKCEVTNSYHKNKFVIMVNRGWKI